MTLMRAWLAESRLTAVLNNPAPDANAYELQSLEMLLREKNESVRGTVMVDECTRGTSAFRLCKPISKPVDLMQLGVYEAVLTFVQERHPEFGYHESSTGMYLEEVPPLLPRR
jgi:hypothetical protein